MRDHPFVWPFVWPCGQLFSAATQGASLSTAHFWLHTLRVQVISQNFNSIAQLLTELHRILGSLTVGSADRSPASGHSTTIFLSRHPTWCA